MKLTFRLTRVELASKAYIQQLKEKSGDAQHLPDNARLVAEAINKILTKKEDI